MDRELRNVEISHRDLKLWLAKRIGPLTGLLSKITLTGVRCTDVDERDGHIIEQGTAVEKFMGFRVGRDVLLVDCVFSYDESTFLNSSPYMILNTADDDSQFGIKLHG